MKNRIRIVAAAGALLLTAAPVYAQESTEAYEITAEVNAEESEAIQSGQPEQTETGAEKKTNGNAVGEAEQTEKTDAGVTEQPEEEPAGGGRALWRMARQVLWNGFTGLCWDGRRMRRAKQTGFSC